MYSTQVVQAVGLFGKLDNRGRQIISRQVGLRLPANPDQIDAAFMRFERSGGDMDILIGEMEDELEFA